MRFFFDCTVLAFLVFLVFLAVIDFLALFFLKMLFISLSFLIRLLHLLQTKVKMKQTEEWKEKKRQMESIFKKKRKKGNNDKKAKKGKSQEDRAINEETYLYKNMSLQLFVLKCTLRNKKECTEYYGCMQGILGSQRVLVTQNSIDLMYMPCVSPNVCVYACMLGL